MLELVCDMENDNENLSVNLDTLSKEISNKSKPINWAYICGSSRVILLGDNHMNSVIRYHIQRRAHEFQKIGVTHYAIEAYETNPEVFQRLPERLLENDVIDLSKVDVGPVREAGSRRKSYEWAIKAFARQGVKIITLDLDLQQKGGLRRERDIQAEHERRESFMTQRITDLLTQGPDVKICALIGQRHVSKRSIEKPIPLARRLVEAGIPVVNVVFKGGDLSLTPPFTDEQLFYDAVEQLRLTNNEFMLDLRQQTDLTKMGVRGGVDFIVYLPQWGY